MNEKNTFIELNYKINSFSLGMGVFESFFPYVERKNEIRK